MDISKYKEVIYTGQFEMGTYEQKEVISSILKENTEYKYEIYFHWFNVIHELGHAILSANNNDWQQSIDDEQLVNDFAVAYWSHYGEAEKIELLYKIIFESIENFIPPISNDSDYMKYAKDHWNQEDFFTFNNYGWFQFNCVISSIRKNYTLESVLKRMMNKKLVVQPKTEMSYETVKTMPESIINNAILELSKWGVSFPLIEVKLIDNPNIHMCHMELL